MKRIAATVQGKKGSLPCLSHGLAFHGLLMTLRSLRQAIYGLCFCLISIVLLPPAFASDNLIPNPDFITSLHSGTPHFWYHGENYVEGLKRTEFTVGPWGTPPLPSLGITGGKDRAGEWWCKVDGFEKGERYLLTFRLYRERFDDGVFPEVELFKNRHRLSNHLTIGGWQVFSFVFVAPEESTHFRFINEHPLDFYLSSPVIMKLPAGAPPAHPDRRRHHNMSSDFFPLVAYGARPDDYALVRDLGFNAVVAAVANDTVEPTLSALKKTGLMIVADPRDKEVIRKLSDSPSLLGWYIEDEPEGRSVPIEQIVARGDMIRGSGSEHPTFMAMVRPEFAAYYRDAADVILMDQYPVPTQPLVWLSKSMDEARRTSGKSGIWAVIQAFGGGHWADEGWPRQPTYEEMKALSFLAIIHSAKGLFFFTLPDREHRSGSHEAHLQNIRRLVQELGHMSPIFLSSEGDTLDFIPESLYAYAPDGSRPVHLKHFRGEGDRDYILAVNVLDKPVRGKVSGIRRGIRYLDEYRTGKRLAVKDANIVDDFGPYAAKLYVTGRGYKNVRITDDQGALRALFSAEVAETEMERRVGLMFRELPSDEHALLFEFAASESPLFHALNTTRPFDLLLFDHNDRVSVIYRDIPPCRSRSECRPYGAGMRISTALELRGGAAMRYSIKEGDRIELH